MKKYDRFFLLAFLLVVSLFLMEQTKQLTDKDYAPVMRDAAEKTERAFQAVRDEKLARGFAISQTDDPNQTGMIGDPYTDITTTLGNLEAKRSTTNPNTAAMVVDMFYQLGLEPGDHVAVNLSSSFPAVNLSVLCAMDAMGLDGTVINSVGASTYGANLPEFTYLDMEHFLLDNGYLENHTVYYSMGGSGDLGKEMPPTLCATIKARLSGFGYQLIEIPDLEENIDTRFHLYTDRETISCFVNAGGNLMAFGGGSEMAAADNGMIRPSSRLKGPGLIPRFLEQDVPVIHLLNMKSLLPAYGLPVDPIPLPPAGQGGVYQSYHYPKAVFLPLLFLNLLCFFWASKGLGRKLQRI